MGRALDAFRDIAEAGRWEPTRVEATVLRFEEDPMDRWHVEAEWFERLLDYRLSETEFSTRVPGTLDGVGDEGE